MLVFEKKGLQPGTASVLLVVVLILLIRVLIGRRKTARIFIIRARRYYDNTADVDVQIEVCFPPSVISEFLPLISIKCLYWKYSKVVLF